MGSMAIELNKLKAQSSGKHPSQSLNPRENASAITLRSGTQLVQIEIVDVGDTETQKEPVLEEKNDDFPQTSEVPISSSKTPFSTYVPPLPFPRRFANSKNAELEKEILDIYKKLHKKLTGNEVMSVGENASAVLQKKLPPKCKDPGSFTIPVEIGNKRIGKAMLELGASVNIMPTSIYESLKLGPLKPTNIVLELADHTNVYSRGIIEDVLVQVNRLVFPADFCVLEMDDGSDASIPLLLGRPFMKTAKTVIDVDGGILTMKFDDEIIRFNMFEVMRYPSDVHSGVHNV
ncbi:uncharacterized protein LOC113360093 [Papaver somniferum]|uniref:uncharacterized protein LOC113360093 n=1 Tax=Papaver somniferum TaxID=3469 RepID=UPI000E70490A|nr:uncharacterized protein LOC113360093 [Papaver somniferum]